MSVCIAETGASDSQSLKLMAVIDDVGRYYQIGCSESGCDMYTLSVTIDAASGLLQVAIRSLMVVFWHCGRVLVSISIVTCVGPI